jgi:hypothetical protein
MQMLWVLVALAGVVVVIGVFVVALVFSVGGTVRTAVGKVLDFGACCSL